MTLHNAKGLEFPVVFVTGMEEGLLPYFKAIGNNEEVSEERRLCYVGMTRAKDILFLSGARKRKLLCKAGGTGAVTVHEGPAEELLQLDRKSG